MKIVTLVVNNPIFIEIQYYTLKKYMKEDYEFIVFNDAKNFPDYTNNNDIRIKRQIIETCNQLDIQCINIPNCNHQVKRDPNVRRASSLNFILEYQKENPSKYLFLDSHMFLIDDFDINKYTQYDCAVVLQCKKDSETDNCWNGLYYFDTTKMKNLDLLSWNCVNNICGINQTFFEKQFTKSILFNDSLNELPESIIENNIHLINFLMLLGVKIENNDFKIYDDVFLHLYTIAHLKRPPKVGVL
jgi:hypothetical protein